MTRNVRIQESGTNQDFSDVKTVTTPVVGGGNATWMPEDETAVGEITITGNGEFVPSEYDLYGFYKVNVMVPGGGEGQYVEPSGIGVNVDGTIPMTMPDGRISNVSVGTGPYMPPPAGIGGTVEGINVIGGTIGGIDPDTGDYVQYTVVDSNGVPTLSATTPQSEPRPASIRILTPPNKTTYEPGELILFSGLTVGVYDQSGNPFTAPSFLQENHTYGPYDGTVPFHELHFPVKYASAETETMVITPAMEQSGFTYPVAYSMGSFQVQRGSSTMFMSTEASDDVMFVCSYDGTQSQVFAFSKKPNETVSWKYTFTYGNLEPSWQTGTQELATAYTFNGKTVYMSVIGYLTFTGDTTNITSTPSICRGPSSPENNSGKDAWALLYGTTNGGGSIPIEWTSPYDGIAYGDSFRITVKSQESGSGDEGGGGGHSF